jgi:SAM-dependent methyltransferase
MTAPGDPWQQHAGWWQEHFTDGADPEYTEQILPLAREWLAGYGLVLDLGCGEGQLARVVAAAGATIVGVDPTGAQLVTARERGGGPRYAQAGAEAVPLRSGAVDAVVACLVFEHIDGVDEAVAEVARVLRPGGRFVFFLNHPLIQAPGSGFIDDHTLDPPEQYWRVGPYLPESTDLETIEPGVVLPFVHRPLSRYVNLLIDHGLELERMIEPPPPPGFIERAPEYSLAVDFPRLLVLVARRRPSVVSAR